jgi:hypothetical protein
VAEKDYDEGTDTARTICQQQSEFNFCHDTPPGVDINSIVKGLCCRWGRRCSKCENTYDELQGSSLFPLVSRFDNLTELVLQIPISTTALGLILQACHLNLQKLDNQSENRAKGSSALPPLPQLSQLTIRYHHTNNDDTAHNLKCTSDIFSFIEAVSSNLYKMVITRPTLKFNVIAALTALRGLNSLQILELANEKSISPLNEYTEPFSQMSQLEALSMPLSLWCMFPQGYFKSLQVLNLKYYSEYDDSFPRNPFFTMTLRSVSVNFPLDLASLETLGKAPFLERLEINLPFYNYYDEDISDAGVYDTHAFFKLKELTMHEYYFDYMQNFELPKLTQFELSDFMHDFFPEMLEIPEIPWSHQLLSLKVSCSNRCVSWNSQASFPKLEAMDLDFSELHGYVVCQFPALRKLRLYNSSLYSTLCVTPSRFPKLSALEFSFETSIPDRIPVKYLSAGCMSISEANSLMKYGGGYSGI